MKKVLDNIYFGVHCKLTQRKDIQMEQIMEDMAVALQPIFEQYTEREIIAALEELKMTIFFVSMKGFKDDAQ